MQSTSPRWFWSSLWICQVWAFLLFLPALAELTTAYSRYIMFWSTSTLLVYLGSVCAVGLLLFGVGALIRKWKPDDFHALAGVGALGSLLFLIWALIHDWWKPGYQVISETPLIAVLTILITVKLVQNNVGIENVARGLAKASLIISPLVPIFWFNAFQYPTYTKQPTSTIEEVKAPVSEEKIPKENVYIFVFDGWSAKWTIPQGILRKDLPNLQRASQHFCTFTDGHSASCHTSISLPRLLYQRKDAVVLHRGKPAFSSQGQFKPMSEEPSIFQDAGQQGYRTYMVGWLHPYHVMLGDQADYIHSTCFAHALGRSPLEVLGSFYWRWAGRYFGPTVGKLISCGKHHRENHAFLWQNRELLNQARAILSDPRPSGQFAVMHLPLPHFPYIFRADGTTRPKNGIYSSNRSNLAYEQIIHLDRIIGEFIDTLKKLGKYENSTIILTSDHTQRWDPNLRQTARAYTHVPLFVKLPHQKNAQRIDAPFNAVHLFDLLRQAKSSPHFRDAGVADLVESHDGNFKVDDREINMRVLSDK